jgi:hypothetical protein
MTYFTAPVHPGPDHWLLDWQSVKIYPKAQNPDEALHHFKSAGDRTSFYGVWESVRGCDLTPGAAATVARTVRPYALMGLTPDLTTVHVDSTHLSDLVVQLPGGSWSTSFSARREAAEFWLVTPQTLLAPVAQSLPQGRGAWEIVWDKAISIDNGNDAAQVMSTSANRQYCADRLAKFVSWSLLDDITPEDAKIVARTCQPEDACVIFGTSANTQGDKGLSRVTVSTTDKTTRNGKG